MREELFPNIYTEWDNKKDIKISDVGNIIAYENYVNNGDIIAASSVLENMKDKIMTTSEWQERYDVCDEMYNYLENKQSEGEDIYTGYNCADSYPTGTTKEGYMLFHLSDGSLLYTEKISTFKSKDITYSSNASAYHYGRINYDTNRLPPSSYTIYIKLNGTFVELPEEHKVYITVNNRLRLILIWRNNIKSFFNVGTLYTYFIRGKVGETKTIDTDYFTLKRTS